MLIYTLCVNIPVSFLLKVGRDLGWKLANNKQEWRTYWTIPWSVRYRWFLTSFV